MKRDGTVSVANGSTWLEFKDIKYFNTTIAEKKKEQKKKVDKRGSFISI